MNTPAEEIEHPGLVVDLHAHFMPADLPDLSLETGDRRWPRLVVEGPADLNGRVVRGDETFRVVRRPCWDTVARISEMDDLGVDVQVISPIPVSLAYWSEPAPGLLYARHVNNWLAGAVEGGAGRLRGLGTVPLQDPFTATAEMVRCVDELGLSGLEIGTLVGATELDDPRLRGFFAAAEERQVPLFIHPIDTGCVGRATSVDLSFGVGMLTDTALAASALVFGGVLAEFPGLRICLSHGGGALPWMLPRLKFGRGLSEPGRDAQWDELVRLLYVDALVFDPRHIPLLLDRFGGDHVVAGSDYPFLPDGPSPQAIIDEAGVLGQITRDQANAMKGHNALAFLGETVPTRGTSI